MCVAICVPVGVKPPSDDDLAQCERANRDGGGIAWSEGNTVRWLKGITLKEMRPILDAFAGGSPGMFIHFRISTAGGVSDELCHPFPVSRTASTDVAGKAKMVMMHNGTLRNWQETLLQTLRTKLPPGDWSDTRAMAFMAGQYGENMFNLFDEKVATLDHRGNIRRYGGRWTEYAGSYFSNLHWQPKNVVVVGQYTGGKYTWTEEDERWASYLPNRTYHDKRKGPRQTQPIQQTFKAPVPQPVPQPVPHPIKAEVTVPTAIKELTLAEKEQFLPGWADIAKEFDPETADAFLAEEIAEMQATPATETPKPTDMQRVNG